MKITEESLAIIQAEEESLSKVIFSLENQAGMGKKRLHLESRRARELTSQIVAAREGEDKQMLASDEAVSHQLSEQKRAELKNLEKLLDRPYFAHIIIEEEHQGRTKEIEYKLGFTANPDCRIIDWRKAPIAKLYYEYQEGDEYSELIQGRDRRGNIKRRTKLDIQQGTLQAISCRLGSFKKSGQDWQPISKGKTVDFSPHSSLPDILALITPEQFKLITEDAQTAVLLQGVAGSGKTTVALHRLAWLLHGDNSPLLPEQCVVLVMSKALKSYISQTLPGMGAPAVRVLTLKEWCDFLLSRVLPELAQGNEGSRITRPSITAAPQIRRLKRSAALSLAWEQWVAGQSGKNAAPECRQALLELLRRPERILACDKTKLLDREIISEALAHTESCFAKDLVDPLDDPYLIRFHQIKSGGTFLLNGAAGRYGHIVADEAQELSMAELAIIVGSVKNTAQLTLVGDTEQEIFQNANFLGWDELRQHFAMEDNKTSFTTLSVSHRSTLPIMRLADYISGKQRTTEGKKGRPPLWFKCLSEDEGVRQALGWLERVLKRYPNTLIAVICRDLQEARQTISFLQPTFGPGVRLGGEDSFNFAEGIIVSTAENTKGLEFPNILLWNPSHQAYPPTDLSRSLLYVAVTRAQENLCLVTWGKPSALLPSINSRLVRGQEPDAKDEETTPKKILFSKNKSISNSWKS